MQRNLRLLKPTTDVSKISYQEELLLLATHTLKTLSSIVQTCEITYQSGEITTDHHLPELYDATTSLYWLVGLQTDNAEHQ